MALFRAGALSLGVPQSLQHGGACLLSSEVTSSPPNTVHHHHPCHHRTVSKDVLTGAGGDWHVEVELVQAHWNRTGRRAASRKFRKQEMRSARRGHRRKGHDRRVPSAKNLLCDFAEAPQGMHLTADQHQRGTKQIRSSCSVQRPMLRVISRLVAALADTQSAFPSPRSHGTHMSLPRCPCPPQSSLEQLCATKVERVKMNGASSEPRIPKMSAHESVKRKNWKTAQS